jgi:hypothetical protein
MSHNPIPQRQPIGDLFSGVVIQAADAQALASSPSEGADVLYEGSMIIRYGVRFLGKPHISIVPGLVAIDYGEMLTGDEAWTFLLKRSNLYPRAEVFGFRNDGRDDMITVKNLDLALPVEVLVFSDETATSPIAKPTALIASDEQAAELPPRLLQSLPRFPTIQAWREAS